MGKSALDSRGAEIFGFGHLLKVLDNGQYRVVFLDIHRDDAISLGDIHQGIVIETLVPREQAGIGEIGDRGHARCTREGVIPTVAPLVIGTQELIIHVVRIAVHLVIPPDACIGGVDPCHHHTMAGKELVPLAALTVLDEEELILVRRVETVSDVATVQRFNLQSASRIDQNRRGETQCITLIEAVSHRVAAKVVAAATRHDRPLTGVAALSTAAAVIGVVEVGQTQHMTELVAEGADAVDIAVITRPTGDFG